MFPWDYKTAELGNDWLNVTTLFIDFFARIGWAYDLKTVPDDIVLSRAKRTGDGSYGYDDHSGEDGNLEDDGHIIDGYHVLGDRGHILDDNNRILNDDYHILGDDDHILDDIGHILNDSRVLKSNSHNGKKD